MISREYQKYVMILKNSSWRQKYVVTSKSYDYVKNTLCLDVEKYIMTLKMMSWDQSNTMKSKVRHGVKKYMTNKLLTKGTSKIGHDIKNDVKI